MLETGESHILAVATKLVDNRTGLLARVEQLPKEIGSPDFVYVSAKTCNLDVLSPHRCGGTFIGTGVATDLAHATAKALGEAIERYCSAILTMPDFRFSSAGDADFPCADPKDFVLFSTHQYKQPQFPYRPFAKNSRVGWISAVDLQTRKPVHVPASMVYLSYELMVDETPITQQISTGLACHSALVLAALKALSEVIERDAVAVTWLGRIQQPHIALETLSASNQELVSRLTQPGTTIHLLSLQTDHGIPVIFSIMESKMPDAPAAVVAAAANLDPEQAVRKSLEELAQVWCFSQVVKANRSEFRPGIGWANVKDIEAHGILYFSRKNRHLTEFLLTPRQRIPFSSIPNFSIDGATRDLHTVIEKILSTHHRPLLTDITSEDVRSLGLWVVKSLIPGFHPLFMGHGHRAIGLSRIAQVQRSLGLAPVQRESDLNQAPHPFS